MCRWSGLPARARSEVGGRVELSRLTVSDGVSDVQQGHARVAGTYTHYFPACGPSALCGDGDARAGAYELDGAAIARSLRAGGSLHWLSPLVCRSTPESKPRSGRRFEQDGLKHLSLCATDVAAVAGMNFFVGTRHRKPPRDDKPVHHYSRNS